MINDEHWTVAGPIRGPLLTPGPRGAFDADGVTVTSVLRIGDRLLAYYLGWTTGGSAPFTNFIGAASGDPAGTEFVRVSPAPVVGRSSENPLTVGYPWVLRDGTGFRMWFGSHLRWGATGLEMEHVIKEACSRDGLVWDQAAGVTVPLIGPADPTEFAVSRPVALREKDGSWSMWYARRCPGYKLGFASSAVGETWQRDDSVLAFTGVSEEWENRERTYPCVFDHAGRRYMLYNGNGYGRTGFGLAVLQED
jgi:hypothetical protein